MFQGIASNLRKVSKELLLIEDNLESITNDRNLLPLRFVKWFLCKNEFIKINISLIIIWNAPFKNNKSQTIILFDWIVTWKEWTYYIRNSCANWIHWITITCEQRLFAIMFYEKIENLISIISTIVVFIFIELTLIYALWTLKITWILNLLMI